jgi:hypothetical protein
MKKIILLNLLIIIKISGFAQVLKSKISNSIDKQTVQTNVFDSFSSPTINEVSGSGTLSLSIRKVNTSYQVQNSDFTIICLNNLKHVSLVNGKRNQTTEEFLITLPSASENPGKIINIINGTTVSLGAEVLTVNVNTNKEAEAFRKKYGKPDGYGLANNCIEYIYSNMGAVFKVME